MTFHRLMWVAIYVATAGSVPAADWNTSPAFAAFYNLDYEKAVTLLETQVQSAPRDPALHNHLAQALLYRALHRAGALDATAALSPLRFLNSPKPNVPAADQRRFHAAVGESLRLTQTAGTGPDLYARGVAYIHRANFEMFVNKSWRAALRDATSARHLHQKASAASPALVDAQLIPATHDYVVGSLPWYAKALGFLAGFRGDKAQGIAGIERVAQHGQRTRVEANLLLALVARREGKPTRAAEILGDLCRQFPLNYLYRMERIRSYRLAGDQAAAQADLALLRQYPNLPPDRLRAFADPAAP